MPRIKSKQIDVSTPINPGDIVNLEYLQNYVSPNSGVSNSSLSIQDEGVFVSSGVTTINFIGSDVLSKYNETTNSVDVYIPSIQYTANLTSLTENYTTTARYISKPTVENNPFNVGDWNLSSTHPVVNKTTDFNFSSDIFGFTDENTYIVASIYKIVGSTNVENLIAQSSASTIINSNFITNNIEIRLNSITPDNNRYSNKIDSIKFYLNNLLTTGGRFRIKISLVDVNYTYNYISQDIFYDTNYYFNESNSFNLSGLTIVENPSNIIIKYLSGVKYYTSGSSFIVNVNNITYPNYLTYTTPHINFVGPEYNLPALNATTTQLSGWTNSYLSTNLSYLNNNWDITNTRFYTLSTTANVSARSIDWSYNSYIVSNNASITIDTINDVSDNNTEDFANESYRLQSNLTAWDSSLSLLDIDNGDGLQCYNSRLYYPTILYTNTYYPYPATQPDYSSVSGDKSYYRIFTGSAFSSNGILVFSDHNLTESDINDGDNSNILLSVSIDNGTTWFSLNKEFLTLPIGNNEGARINSDTYSLDINYRIQFTFGISSSDSLILRIIFKDNAIARTKYIGSIDITGSNWL